MNEKKNRHKLILFYNGNVITGDEVKYIEKVLPIAPWIILNLYSKKTEQKKRKQTNKMFWTESRVGVEGAKKISELLMTNDTLTSLYLSGGRWDIMLKKITQKWKETIKMNR